jgi:DNA-binding GntR family transcriptional regulator
MNSSKSSLALAADLADTEPVATSFAIERPVLHDAVTGAMRKMIVEGTLPPGARLNERDLCALLGVSRTPLREALKVLAAEGLVEHQPNRGATVAVLEAQDVSDMFDLLGCLEAYAGELACERINPDELAQLEAMTEEMAGCHARGALPEYYELNRRIHDTINLIARNSALRQTYQNLNRRVQALRFRSNHDPRKWERAMHDHREMIEALGTRDGKRMAALMRTHLEEKKRAVLATLARPA